MTVPLPEPARVWERPPAFFKDEWTTTPLFTADQLRAYGAACRADERERICNLLPGGESVDPQWVADAIRNMEQS